MVFGLSMTRNAIERAALKKIWDGVNFFALVSVLM